MIRFAIRLLLAMSMEEAREVLGFPRSYAPGPDEIIKAYRRKAVENHPDRGGSHEKMVEINVAKEVLEGKRHDRFRPSKPTKSPEEERHEAAVKAKAAAQRIVGVATKNIEQALENTLGQMDLFKGRLNVRDFFLDDFADALDAMQDDLESIPMGPIVAKAKALIESLAAKSLRIGKKYLAIKKAHGELAAGLLGMGGASPVTLDRLYTLKSELELFTQSFAVLHQESRQLIGMIRTREELPAAWDNTYHRPHVVLDSFVHDYAKFNLEGAVRRYAVELDKAVVRVASALQSVNPDFMDMFPLDNRDWRFPEDFERAGDMLR